MNMVNDFLRSQLECGLISFESGVIAENEQCLKPESIDLIPVKDGIDIAVTYPGGIHDELKLREAGTGEITVARAFSNNSGRVFNLRELRVTISGIAFGGALADDYFYHVENPRIYSMLAMPVDLMRSEALAGDSEYDQIAGNRWADPGVAGERIGASPYQPFPAILLGNMKSSRGLVHGTLSQKIFFHNYLVRHNDNAVEIDIISSSKALAWRSVAPGETVRDHWYLGITEQADDYIRMFNRYKDMLRQKLPPLYGATEINRNWIVWGSWNDGIFRDIDQERLLKNAEFVSKHFPTVKWLQIDDGYATLALKESGAHGLGCVYEEENGIDTDKFPEGLKVFCDKVRRTGLRPAVWIGGKVPSITPLYKDHPEWFVDYDYRIPNAGILDVSKPEVREYMEQAADFFFNACGFEGMKHDFWSYAFEDSHDLLANHERSGYEWRTWWLQLLRDRLPADGYLQTGCDIVMANPFLAEHFSNYRYGIDIGGGNWDYVKTNFQWGAACFALQIGDLFVPNSDSVGLLPELTDDEAMLCINYCLASGSMVELAGWLYKDPDHPRFKLLQKAMCCPNNGHDVYFPGYDYRSTHKAPELWSFNTPHFSLLENNDLMPSRTLAIFNLEDETRILSCTLDELGLDPHGSYWLTDVWSGETTVIDQAIARELLPHASCLLAITSKDNCPKLLDSNLKVDAVSVSGNDMSITFGFDGEYELLFNRRPVNCEVIEIPGAFRLTGNAIAGTEVKVSF